MKKVLFATTALVAFAGAAAAEVTIAGDARMGLTYDESRADEFQMENRVRVRFTATGTTDGGLEWSASTRINNATSTFTGTDLGVTISGAFGSLTFGDESSAAEYAVGDLAGVGYGPQLTQNETRYITGARALYSYSASGFTFWASAGQIGTDEFSLGARYAMDGLTVGLGYEDDGTIDHIVGSASYAFGDTTVRAVYGTADDINFDQYGLSIAHRAGAATIEAFYRVTDNDPAIGDADLYGIGADYALGGGATLSGGIVSDDGNTEANLGLRFAF